MKTPQPRLLLGCLLFMQVVSGCSDSSDSDRYTSYKECDKLATMPDSPAKTDLAARCPRHGKPFKASPPVAW